eukprot:403348475
MLQNQKQGILEDPFRYDKISPEQDVQLLMKANNPKRRTRKTEDKIRQTLIKELVKEQILEQKRLDELAKVRLLDHERICRSLFYRFDSQIYTQAFDMENVKEFEDPVIAKELKVKRYKQTALVELKLNQDGHDIWKIVAIGIEPKIVILQTDKTSSKTELIPTNLTLPLIRNFSWCLSPENILYVTGGETRYEKSYTQSKLNYGFAFTLSEDSQSVNGHQIQVPQLIKGRFNHSSFYLDHKLFVIFGRNMKYFTQAPYLNDEYHTTYEYWDTRNGTKIGFISQQLNCQLRVQQVMMFHTPIEQSKYYFFGGKSDHPEYNTKEKCPLYNFQVQIQQNQQGIEEINVDISQEMDEQLNFQGQPIFHSTLQNKLSFKNGLQWVFIDQNNLKHYLDLQNRQVNYPIVIKTL